MLITRVKNKSGRFKRHFDCNRRDVAMVGDVQLCVWCDFNKVVARIKEECKEIGECEFEGFPPEKSLTAAMLMSVAFPKVEKPREEPPKAEEPKPEATPA